MITEYANVGIASLRHRWATLTIAVRPSTGVAAFLLGLSAVGLPAAAFHLAVMLWLLALGALMALASIYAAVESYRRWLTTLPSLTAVALTTVAVAVRSTDPVLLVAVVALLITAHLIALDLAASHSGLRAAGAETGAFLAACCGIALTVLVSGLPALEWLWLAGVGLAAAAAAYVLVAGQHR